MRNKLLLSSFLIFVLLLFACAENDIVDQEENSGGKNTVISQTIIIPMEKIKTLNPIISADEDVFFMSKLLYRNLFSLDDSLSAMADVASDYEYSGDGSLLLTIRDDIIWEDGNRLVPADVKFTIDAILSLPQNSGSLYMDSSGAIKSCKLEKDGKIRVYFTDAGNRDLTNLLFPIMPSHKYKRAADLLKDDKNFMPMGTGSYKVEEIDEGKHIVLTGSSGYKGFVAQNKLVFKYLRDKEDAVNLFGTDEVNVVLLRDVDRGTLLAREGIDIHSFISNEAEVLMFNLNEEVLQDPAVRRAIAAAIDREAIVHNGYFQSGVIHDGLYYPGYLGVETNYSALSGSSGEITLRLIYNSGNNSRKIAADIIKHNLANIGISLHLAGLPEDEYVQALSAGDFDLCIGGYKINRRYDLQPILGTDGQLNYASYSDEKMDELLVALQSGHNPEAKRDILMQIEDLCNKDLPYMTLLYKTYGLAVSKGLSGNISPGFDHIFNGIENWQISYEVEK